VKFKKYDLSITSFTNWNILVLNFKIFFKSKFGINYPSVEKMKQTNVKITPMWNLKNVIYQ
jgi:hypothetical protein